MNITSSLKEEWKVVKRQLPFQAVAGVASAATMTLTQLFQLNKTVSVLIGLILVYGALKAYKYYRIWRHQ